MKYTAKTTLDKIIRDPENMKILAKHKVPCIGCPMMQLEMKTLEIGRVAKIYKIKLEPLLKDLQTQAKKKKE